MKQLAAKGCLLSSMAIFGTIGLFVRYIPLPSGVISVTRGFAGALFLLLVLLARKKKPNVSALGRSLWLLALSGGCIGLNWVLLFEAYRHTTVAAATLCYYLAPTFVTLAAPAVLGEKLTAKKTVCALVALAGMVPVSGVLGAGFDAGQLTGAACGVGAAVMYAAAVLCNKKIASAEPFDRTVIQLFVAAVVLLPYVLLTTDLAALTMDARGILLLAAVCIVHTGIAYLLYFTALPHLRAQTAAIFSYLDPVLAIVLSAIVLKEDMTWLTALGAAAILGAALVSEIEIRGDKKHASISG